MRTRGRFNFLPKTCNILKTIKKLPNTVICKICDKSSGYASSINQTHKVAFILDFFK